MLEGSTRNRLRASTRSGHEAAEASLALAGELQVEDLRRVLSAFVRVFAPVERVLAAWEPTCPGAWVVERRSGLAERDLVALGATPPVGAGAAWAVMAPAEGPDGRATALGLAYVLEGSRLGGDRIARRFATDQPDAPSTAYFAAVDAPRWAAFTEALDAAGLDDAGVSRAVAAAGSVFAEFVGGPLVAHV